MAHSQSGPPQLRCTLIDTALPSHVEYRTMSLDDALFHGPTLAEYRERKPIEIGRQVQILNDPSNASTTPRRPLTSSRLRPWVITRLSVRSIIMLVGLSLTFLSFP